MSEELMPFPSPIDFFAPVQWSLWKSRTYKYRYKLCIYLHTFVDFFRGKKSKVIAMMIISFPVIYDLRN